MIKPVSVFSLLLFSVLQLAAQDTLPDFSVKNLGQNRIVAGWVNKFTDIKQITIQRSFDSTKNFRSILTVPDPTVLENGYLDTKAPNDHMFYRLYILLDKGVFLFSPSKRPVLDTVVARKPGNNSRLPEQVIPPVINGDSVNLNLNGLPGTNRPKADIWKPSAYVYTFKDGYIQISLPAEEDKKYTIKFFTMEDELLFELKDLKERKFKIDKANFYKSGWFRFELYENNELKEKNKFFLPKEF